MNKRDMFYKQTMGLRGTCFPSWADMLDALHNMGYAVMEWDENDEQLGEYSDDDFVQVWADDDDISDTCYSLFLAHRGNGEYWVVDVDIL